MCELLAAEEPSTRFQIKIPEKDMCLHYCQWQLTAVVASSHTGSFTPASLLQPGCVTQQPSAFNQSLPNISLVLWSASWWLLSCVVLSPSCPQGPS
jgi:hypothetical protein